MPIEKVILISPRGFCAGVDRAVKTVEQALEAFGSPIYVKHEIVHNKAVCNDLRSRGVIFIEDISEVPDGSVCIFSAHGISPKIREEARGRNLRTIDATCPLVTKIHLEVEKFAKSGDEIIYIGHKGHPEVVGVMGIRPDITKIVENADDVDMLVVKDPHKLVYLTQTTLSVDECSGIISAIKKKFPDVKQPPKDDICYATTNRQSAIKAAAGVCDLILVIGSKNSSNSNRLVETAIKEGVDSHLIDGFEDVEKSWLENKRVVGISAGASAPEHLIEEIVDHFRDEGVKIEHLNVIDEKMTFTLPYELRNLKAGN